MPGLIRVHQCIHFFQAESLFTTHTNTTISLATLVSLQRERYWHASLVKFINARTAHRMVVEYPLTCLLKP